MQIVRTQDGSRLIMEVIGRLDTTTAPEFSQTISTCLEGVSELILDFDNLEYVSSAGLRVILTAEKTMAKHGSMKIIHVNESVMEVFELTGFADILTIE